jgi:hypothetical protein
MRRVDPELSTPEQKPAWRTTALIRMNPMTKKSQPHLRAGVKPDLLTEQGFRLISSFRKLQDVHDRERVIALAEQLLDAQTAKSN